MLEIKPVLHILNELDHTGQYDQFWLNTDEWKPGKFYCEKDVLALQARITDLEEQLEPFLEQERERIAEQEFMDRLENIIDILFPKYFWNLPDSEKPIRHPEKAWWWNGGSLTQYSVAEDGNILVSVNSYVGGGNSDDFEFTIPAEWMKKDNIKEYLHVWCLKKQKRMDDEKIAADLKKAIADNEYALNRLKEAQHTALEKGLKITF